MGALARLLKGTARSAAFLTLFLVVAVGVVYGLLKSGALTGPLDGIITMLARKEGVFFVRAEGVSGNLPEHLVARRIEVGDDDGVWLTVEDADIHWHPFDLFHPADDVKWRINVDDARARRLVWTRLPRDSDDEDDKPFRWDRFIRILVGHIRVDDLELSGEILGGSTTRVSAEGSGVLGEWDHGFVRLEIEHVDDCRGRASIDLKTGGSPLELSGTVTAEEEPGGALAALARLDGAGSVKLDVRASGPMRDWKAEADVHASGIGRLQAEARLAFTAEGPFEGTGTFDPVEEQRRRYLVGAGAPMRLSAKGAWSPDVELRLDRVVLDADGRELTAKGRLDLVTRVFDVEGRLAHRGEGERVTTTIVDVASARLEGKGTLGDGGNLEAKLRLDAPSVADVSGGAFEATLKAVDPKGEGRPRFELSAGADGLKLGEVVLPIVGESARLTANGLLDVVEGVLTTEQAHLEGVDLDVSGPVAFSDEWGSLRATLKAEAASLRSLEAVALTRVDGKASAAVEFTATSKWEDYVVALRVDAAEVGIGEPGWNALLAGSSSLVANWKGALRGPAEGDFEWKAAGIEASATASIGSDGDGLVADARFALDNLARLAEPTQAAVAGRLTATASAHGSLEDFDLEVALRGDRFSWEGLRFDSLTADARAEGLPSRWSGTLGARAAYADLRASLDAKVEMPLDTRVVVRDLVLTGPRTTGSADLDVDLDRLLASGTVKLKSEDLALWRPMTGMAIDGAVDVDLALATSGAPGGKGSPSQLVTGKAGVVHGAMFVEDTQLFLDALEISAEGLVVGAQPGGSAVARATRVRYGTTTLVEGTASARGDGRAWNLETRLDVRDDKEVKVDAAASLVPGLAAVLDVSRFAAEYDGRAVVLDGAASLRRQGRTGNDWTLAPMSIRIGDEGRLAGQASSVGGKLHVEAEAEGLPLGLVSAFAPELDVQGDVGGRLVLDGAARDTAVGEMTLKGRGVSGVGLDPELSTPVDVDATLRLKGGRLAGTAGLAGLTGTTLALTLDAPMSRTAGGAPLSATLVWKGELAPVVGLLPFGEDQVSGRIDADLRATGTMAAPRITGRASIEGGTWDQAATGLALRDLRAELRGSGTSLELDSLTAGDGSGGTVQGRGRLDFADLPGFVAELDLEASDALLARLDLLTMKADAKLALRASRGKEKDEAVGGSITGSVRIDDARVEIPTRFVAGIPEIAVVEVGAVGDAELARAEHRAALDLDLSVKGDNRIFVSGRGVESEWASDLHLRGDTLDARIEGTVTSVRGQISLLGRRFDIDSATLRFDGREGNVPYLTLKARAEAHDITAIAEVTGPATSPAIELRSDPALPRDEVLSRVLFGQSAANLTPMQSVQLARGVAELAGSPLGGSGSGVLSGIGRTLGLDRLDIESSGSDGAAALTASKYLTDNVYLRVQGGLTPEASKLSLEWRVLKHVTIESDVSQDAQGEVGATWRWDY